MRHRAWLIGLCCLLGSDPALSHHLEQSRLELRPLRQGELRGRFLLSPTAFPLARGANADSLVMRLRASFELSVAGVPCETPLTPIELWTEASPSPGHLVDVRCPAPQHETPVSVSVVWRDASELLVTYPETAATEAVSLLLTGGAQGNLLVAEMPTTPATPQAVVAEAVERPRPAQPVSRPRWPSLRGLAFAGAICIAALGLGLLLRRRRSAT